jgi:hypothetical protein
MLNKNMKIERSEEYKSQKFIEYRKVLISRLISKALKNGAVVTRHISFSRLPDHYKFLAKRFQRELNYFETQYTFTFPGDREIFFKEDFDLKTYRKVKVRLKKEVDKKRADDCYAKLKEILHASHNGAEILNWGLQIIGLYYGFKPGQKK